MTDPIEALKQLAEQMFCEWKRQMELHMASMEAKARAAEQEACADAVRDGLLPNHKIETWRQDGQLGWKCSCGAGKYRFPNEEELHRYTLEHLTMKAMEAIRSRGSSGALKGKATRVPAPDPEPKADDGLNGRCWAVAARLSCCFFADWGKNDVDGTERFTVDTPQIAEWLEQFVRQEIERLRRGRIDEHRHYCARCRHGKRCRRAESISRQ